MGRAAPLVIREAFCTATLFMSFKFETNIDKALGGFIISCLVMGLALKFGYPFIASWLEERRNGLHRRPGGPASVPLSLP